MYIDIVPNRKSPPAILLRESIREGKKIVKRTLANLSSLSIEQAQSIRRILKGEKLVRPEAHFDILNSRAHGHVDAVLLTIRKLGLDKLIASRRCKERDLVIAMITSRILGPESKLALSRGWENNSLGELLGVEGADEDALYTAMDWLYERQERIEKRLAERHLQEGGRVLYDLSSSYFEGKQCPLAERGYSRDQKKGKLQVNYGLLTDDRDCPVSISAFSGNTSDPQTLLPQVERLQGAFNLQSVVLVGDRSMIPQKQVDELKGHSGVDWITALKTGAIRKLMDAEAIQLTLFDKRNLFEFTHADFPGEKLVACRNPELALRRKHKREVLLQATTEALEKIQDMVARGSLKEANKIGVRVGRVINQYKMAKHFKLEIVENRFNFAIDEEKVSAEAALDGIYVIRTSLADQLSAEDTVRHYKALSQVERAVRGKARPALDVRFEPQNLTSYSGLILFQHFFSLIGIKERLWGCFRHLKVSPIYSHHVILMLLVVHLIIGCRRLRDVDYYRDDEMVKRLLGLKRFPDVSTISRSLGRADEISVEKVRDESIKLVIERMSTERFARVMLDFDGSVLSTGRHAEGAAVGFNKKKKGARSYYPLFCTVAQTDQVLDVHHRPGNVHDSNGADAFIGHCLKSVRTALPRIKIETRIDSAFFNETIAGRLDSTGAEFTISVPFERFTELKGMIEGRKRWRQLNCELSFFETRWKPKSWSTPYRFIFIRKQVRRQNKAPIQLDLFRPVEYGYEFKVIVTNKSGSPRRVVAFHEGRGSQEGIFAELKSHCQMDYVPVTTSAGNQLYMFARILAHNLTRELQIQITPRARGTTAKRAALWCFREIETLRRTLIQRAGRIIRPAGKMILSMNSNEKLENELLHSLGLLRALGS